MASVCTAEATRAAEQRWFDAHPGQDLMDIAAQAVARKAQELLLGGAVDEIMPDWAASQCVLVLVGGGNNGGDGVFAAAALAPRGGGAPPPRRAPRVPTSALPVGVRSTMSARRVWIRPK